MKRIRMTAVAALLAIPSLLASAAGPAPLPLPDGPVVVVIPDAAAFDHALTGKLRQALTGDLPEKDAAGTAFRRSRVGGKLEEQWGLFAKDLPLTWKEIASLKPASVGITLLAAGDLEAVLAIRTPLAVLPITLPKGETRSDGGIPYQFVARGAGDDRTGTAAWAWRGPRDKASCSSRRASAR